MPIYEFLCDSCGKFELRLPMKDVLPRVACPKCGAPAKREFTPVNFKMNFKEDK